MAAALLGMLCPYMRWCVRMPRPYTRWVAATDKEIDRLVYDLYELTDEEIAVVEG